MNYARSSGLVALVAVALMILPATAAATTLTSPAGTSWTGTVKAASEAPHVLIHTDLVTNTCESVALEWLIESHGPAVTAKGPLTQLSIQCGGTKITLVKKGTLELHKGDGSPGSYDRLTWSGAVLTVTSGASSHCTYSLEKSGSIEFGAVTSSSVTGGKATIHLATQKIPATTFFCGNWIQFTGALAINSPLYLDAD